MKYSDKLLWAVVTLGALFALGSVSRAIVYPDSSAHGGTAPWTKQFAPANYVAPASPPPGIPVKLALSGGATSTSQALTAGTCLRISCTVACAYRVNTGTSTAVADDNQLPANTPERFCLDNLSDHITFFSSAAGSAYVATTLP